MTRTHLLAALQAGLLAALLSGTAHAVVQDGGHGITVDRSVAPQRRGAETLHAVRIDRRAFEVNAAVGRAIELPGSGGASMRARFERAEQQDGNYTWIGKVDTDLGEQAAVITFGPDATFGTIPQQHGQPLRLESSAGRAVLVEGRNRNRMHDGAPSDARIPKLSGKAGRLATQSRPLPPRPANVAPVVDVLVAYTPSLVARLGSTAAVDTRIAYLAQLANQAYYDSPSMVRINIVARQLLDYTVASSNAAALDLVTNPSADPAKAQVDAWRTQYAADLVVVMRAFDSATQPDCGQGWIGGYHGSPFVEASGFSVVSDGASGGYYCDDQTFAHEIGHNLGGHHDYQTAGGDYGTTGLARGHRMTLSADTGFATIMAYPTGPQVHLNRFSNPSMKQCMGTYCGEEWYSDNASVFSDTGWQVANYRGTVTPPEDPVVLGMATATVVEGTGGTKQLLFHASLNSASPNPVTFSAHTQPNFPGAEEGVDYVALAPTRFTIAPGSLGVDVPVTIIGDGNSENPETLSLVVEEVTGAVDHSGRVVNGTVQDDDLPRLYVADVDQREDADGTTMRFRVSLAGVAKGPITYTIGTLTTASTTATPGADFIAVPPAMRTLPAEGFADFEVTTVADYVPEYNEVFLVAMSNVSGAILADGTARGLVRNDDAPYLTINDVAVIEGNAGTKQAVFTVRLSHPAEYPIGVQWHTNGAATATDGVDFQGNAYSQNPVTIPAGQLAATFAVPVFGDTTPEAHETFTVTVATAYGANVVDGVAIGTILNDEPVVLTIADASIGEGGPGFEQYMAFKVQLSGMAPVPVTFDIATLATATTTATPGEDYEAKSIKGMTIPVGQTSALFHVRLVPDTVAEDFEVFVVAVSNVVGATVGDGAAKGTIGNDDPVELSISDATVTEGNSGTKTMWFTVTASQPSVGMLGMTIDSVYTAGTTATPGTDFDPVAPFAPGHTNVFIESGQRSVQVGVPIHGDTEVETNEVLALSIDAAYGATIKDGFGVGTIRNDDTPVMTIADASLAEGHAGNAVMTFTVKLSGPAAAPVTFDIATLDTPTTTAKPGTDYVAKAQAARMIPAGASSATFSVGIVGDHVVEANEVFLVTLSNVTGAVLGDGAARATILNDD